MAALSNTFVNKYIDWLIRAQAIGLNGATAAAGTGLATAYIAAYTVMPTASTAGTEVSTSGTAYARVPVTSSLANWAGTQGAGTTAASSGSSNQTSNNNPITFPVPSGSNWGTIVGFAICDASSAGNIIAFGTQTPNKTVNNGDPAPSFAAGALVFSFN